MAQLALSIAGAAVGSFLGGPIGAKIGWVAGSIIGSLAFAEKQTGPRLDSLKVQSSAYGVAIPLVFGVDRVAGSLIWSLDLEEVEGEVGGKGGPSATVYSYYGTFAVLIGKGQMRSVRRIWCGAVLAHDATGAADNPNAAHLDFTFYPGTDTQDPDPTIEADLGVDNTPAFRGWSYVVFNRLPLERFGNMIPNMMFEVVADGEFADDYAVTSLGAGHPEVWDHLHIRSDGELILIEENTSDFVYAVADRRTGELTTTVTVDPPGSSTFNIHGTTYVPPLDEVWIGGQMGTDSMIWRVDAQTGVLVSSITVDSVFGDNNTPGNAGCIPAYDEAARCVQVVRTSQYATNGFRQFDLYGDETGDRVDLPFTDARALVTGGEFVFIYLGLDYAAALQSVGELVETYDGETYTSKYVGQGTTIATQGTASFADAAFDTMRGRYAVIDTDQDVWFVDDSLSTSFDFVRNTGTADVTGSSVLQYIGALDVYVLVLNSGALHVFDAVDFSTILEDVPLPGGGSLPKARPSPSDAGSIIVAGGSTGDNVVYEKPIYASSLAECVATLCDETGHLEAADYDVTLLTQRLRGYVVDRQGPARAAIEQLATIFMFEAAEVDDKIRFIPRGGAPVATITVDDCGAGIDTAETPPIQYTRAQELDLPRKLTVTAPDPYTDYQPGSQYDTRRVAEAGQDQQIQVAVVMTADENKRAAIALLFDAWVSRESARFQTTRAFARLVPTDPITLAGRRARITSRSDDSAVIRFEAVADDADVIDQVATGVQGTFPGQTVPITVPTEIIVLDTALLRDADNQPGAYVAAWGVPPHWRGALIYRSPDAGATWERMATVPVPGASVGVTLNELGDFTGGFVFDEANSVNVNMRNGAPSSATRAAVFGGANYAAIESTINGDRVWEIIQYRNAVLEDDGTYTLSGLLRGRRGTEWAIAGHSTGDRIVLLSSGTIRTVDLETADVGVDFPYRAVTIGDTIANSAELVVGVTAERLKPWAPWNLRAARDIATGDIDFTWQRRTRLSVRFAGSGGLYYPLGEDSEAYELEIYTDGTYTTVARTLTGLTSETAAYSVAQQTTDFGSAQSTVYVRVYQISAAVERGHYLQAAA